MKILVVEDTRSSRLLLTHRVERFGATAISAENGEEFTVSDIGRLGAIGGLGPFIVGSGEQIADQLQEWVDETDVDGFNLAYAITPGTFEDIVEHVIPILRERGAYPDAYAAGSLRQKLHGRGDRLPAEHKGATFRIGGSGSTSPR